MPNRRLISTRTVSAPNGAPEGSGYVYRGTKQEPPDPAETSERSRRDAEKRAAGTVLRAAREAAGLSQRQASEAAGVSAGYISAVENGHDWPSKRLIAALAAAYGVTPQDLAGSKGSA
jgi:DNA-binding XRE family transcriptional regulator